MVCLSVAAGQAIPAGKHQVRMEFAYDRHSSVFTGKINWGQIDLGLDDQDHLISPQERLRIAMARQ